MRLLPPPTAAVAAWLALASCLAAPQRPAAGILTRCARPAGRVATLCATPGLLHGLPAARASELPHGLPGVAGAEQSALELSQALQRKYEAIRGFAADFVHTYRGGVLNKRLTERGHLLVKKPGKMRWEYTAPEKKLFVSDGVKIYSYVPEDKQVIVSDVPSGDTLTTPVLFLAGRGNLARDFDPSFTDLPPGAPPGSRALKLVPKAAQPDYDWLVVVVDASTLGLRGLMYSDPQGGTSTFSFTNLKENAELTDTAFDFKVPRGVDVVTDPSVR